MERVTCHIKSKVNSLLLFSVPNPCKNVCSHLCLLRPGGYTCACPQGSSPIQFDSNECDAGKTLRPPQFDRPCESCALVWKSVCSSSSHSAFHKAPPPSSTHPLGCHSVLCVKCVTLLLLLLIPCMPGLLLLQPLSQLSQCLLHVDA